jgi:hypothetical protein
MAEETSVGRGIMRLGLYSKSALQVKLDYSPEFVYVNCISFNEAASKPYVVTPYNDGIM